jgi:hypothetical protein
MRPDTLTAFEKRGYQSDAMASTKHSRQKRRTITDYHLETTRTCRAEVLSLSLLPLAADAVLRNITSLCYTKNRDEDL